MISDEDFADFELLVRHHGLDAATRRWARLRNEAESEELAQEHTRRADSAKHGYPPKIIAPPHQDDWYCGPVEGDKIWPALEAELLAAGSIPPSEIERIDEASTKILAYTADPRRARWGTRGLVVGYVQSGKTTNFTSVIAKAVDCGYNLVVVLSGIHNGLRRQTQDRIEQQLCDPLPDRWVKQTTLDHDFRTPSTPLSSVIRPGAERSAVLIVAKKNAAVLRKLVAWIKNSHNDGGISHVRALVIDDEADQASVATPKINPLIRELLSLLPRHTFLGYTATPFANVLIDPAQVDDLYPQDFILSLPPPAGYFGTSKIFGRDELPGDTGEDPLDGYDMVRTVPEEEARQLQPRRGTPFEPTITLHLEQAVLWFWLATAARRVRAQAAHSSMLIHTSMKTAVHRAFRAPLDDLRREVAGDVASGDRRRIEQLRKLWEKETAAVPASAFGLTTPDFDEVLARLPEVIEATRVVLDNSRSAERLHYGEEPVTAIAVGGNTLSRGLTLEGLVVSFFVRAANAYDTLLQMGRWFGFRRGYEDLPRIYMTKELKTWFRHLATVEDEIRLDIKTYEQQLMTPRDVGVRIRTHPKLLVTQKLGAARQDYTSYGGRRLQVRYFRRADADWLAANFAAADGLIADAVRDRCEEEDLGDGTVLWRDVGVARIAQFLRLYQVDPESSDLDRDLLLKYIDNEIRNGRLAKWNVAVMAAADGTNGVVSMGGRQFGRIIRARLADGEEERADIKTLMSKEHRVVDLPDRPRGLRKLPEERLAILREENLDLRERGLLLLYPIDPVSSPEGLPSGDRATRQSLDAVGEVIGLALVFPGNASTSVQNSYISVDTSAAQPVEDVDEGDEVDNLIETDTEEPNGG